MLTALVAIGAAVAAFQQVYLAQSAPQTQARFGARTEACNSLIAAASGAERDIHMYLTKYGETVEPVDDADWARVEKSHLAFIDSFHRNRTYLTPSEDEIVSALHENFLVFGMVGRARKHGAIAGFDKSGVGGFMDIVEKQIEDLRSSCRTQTSE